MQLDHALLRTFLACVDAMSFSRAATRVHKSPATVSMQIQRLEDRIGKPLFMRDTRNLALTRTGEELEGYARRILRLHDEAVEAFRQPEMEGAVTIGAPDDYIAAMLPDVLRRFASLFPRVELNVVCAQSTALLPQVDDGQIDLAIVTRTGGTEGRLIRREPMVWISSRDGQALERDPLPVALYEAGSQARAVTLEALGRSGLRYRSAYSSFSHSALVTLVEAGLAVAAVVQMAVPPTVERVDHDRGLPPLEPLDIILVRSKGAQSSACEALATALLEGEM
ncbi:LysR family transcriptional regulator [Stappia sp. BW2]|uniref:LysR substrate-binding domain-containing protein n=1 Tax=Stappia sp. BW2 TaxID=2592622 RepID=UPI0011DEC649|nr:LysR substrate-binding domain-containing protein [Stappia sp. BW2]TYC80035.1 LysR family transcriptional regulator [Stappia sp. BW2]